DRDAVEAQLVPARGRDGVGHDAALGAGARVLADEQRRVAAVLEHLGVLGPLALHHELAALVERVGDQRVERAVAAGTVAVHHHDLGRAALEGAAHGRVELLGVEAAALLVAGAARVDLVPAADPGDALHVADDEDLHSDSPASSWASPASMCSITS